MALLDTQLTVNLTAFDKWILGGIGSIVTATVALVWRVCLNCAPTIQDNTEKTNRLLTELVGYFKAKAEDGKL